MKPKIAATMFLLMASFSIFTRLMTFRRELGTLWRAFRAPETPMHLKLLMLLVPLYLLSPLDLIPDVVPVLGWLDDAIVIPMLVSWIVRLLPRAAPVQPARGRGEGPIIEGTARRL